MITKDNLKEVLQALNFAQEGNTYTRAYKNGATISVDFTTQSIIYSPQDPRFKEGDYPSLENPSKGFVIHRSTTTNFSSNENFVCLVAVHKLLIKGYAPEHIILEPTFKIGHGQKAYGDILVLDLEFNPLVLIENKTYGAEFARAWNETLKNGGQLFSYYAVHKVPYLCLLAFNSHLEHDLKIICTKDNDVYLEQINKERKEADKKRSFADPANTNARAYFEVWSQTYLSTFTTQGLFEPQAQAYNIGKEKFQLADLRPLSASQMKGIYHEFATILRHHSIGNYENSFYILVDLFLCKLADEHIHPTDLQFPYKGVVADDPLSYCDRLLNLYEEGVSRFFKKDVVNVKKEQIAALFTSAKRYKGKFKEELDALFDKQKYFNIKKFNFIEVENAEEFYLNFKVLVQVAGLIQDLHLSATTHSNQFLGDLFEGFLNRHIHQTEGRFFTPTPITNFIIHSLPPLTSNPKVLDFACGAGHFLSEFMTHHKNAKVYGIEKNKDLSKVAKLACLFKNPNNQAKIFFQDALDHPAPAHKKDFQDFDLILSNPPYSVKGFLSTLDANVITSFTLGHKEIIDPKSYESNNAIECFFIERAQSWLKMGGVFALILPVSVLQKWGIYEKTRALLLDNFKILCIVELNSRTFGSTGTQTIILYAQRVQKFAQDLINALKEADFESANLKEDFTQVGFLQEYCAFRGYPLEDFRAFLQTKNLSPRLKESLKDLPKLEGEQIHALELEKMLLFASVQEEEVLILKSPPEKKGNASNKAKIVEFLGYDWSKRKGDEGIKYASTQNADDPDNEALSNIQSAKHIVTPLYNPDPKNADDPTKLAHALKSFMGSLLANTPRPNLSVYTDPDPAGYQLFSTPLSELIDFSKSVLDKAISLSPKQEAINPFEGGKWGLVRLGEVVSVADYVANGSFALLREKVQYLKQKNYAILVRLKDYSNGWSGDYIYVNKGAYDFLEKSKLNVGDIVMCNVGSLGVCFKVPNLGQPMTLAPNSILIKPCVETIKNDFLFCIFKTDMFQQLIQTISSSMAQPKFNKTDFRNLKIPLPPLQVQEQIIAECAKVEKRAQELQEGIQNYQNLILAVLGVCGLSHTKESKALAVDPKTKAFITDPRTRTYVTEGSQVAIAIRQSQKIKQILETLATLNLEATQSTDPKLEALKNLVQALPSPQAGGWDLVKLGAHCLINQHSHNPSLESQKYRYIDIDCVEKGTGKIHLNPPIAGNQLPTRARRLAPADSVAISSVRPYLKGFAYIEASMPNTLFSTGFAILQGKESLNSKFLYLLFMFSADLMRQMEERMPKASYPSLNTEDFKEFKIPLPPLQVQEQIVSVLSQIEQEIARLDTEIASLEGQEQEILQEFLANRERER
ncbi:N-6 DNA methylase, partial [Helicobacter bizzozeronii]|uniref:N-6 DNA methylase n=1 Tax=Helicobacter bizzozeronii TaxID=56877 RepID=UPI000CF12C41